MSYQGMKNHRGSINSSGSEKAANQKGLHRHDACYSASWETQDFRDSKMINDWQVLGQGRLGRENVIWWPKGLCVHQSQGPVPEGGGRSVFWGS